MHVDVLFDPFGGRWEDLRDAALRVEDAGFDGVWLYDHLAGSVHGAAHVLECWTVLSALAAAVPRIMIGSLVLNVANRDAGTLAVMAATLQEVSGGRVLLGVGAGGGARTPYAAEQLALGRDVAPDRTRRAASRRRSRRCGRRGRAPSPELAASSDPNQSRRSSSARSDLRWQSWPVVWATGSTHPPERRCHG